MVALVKEFSRSKFAFSDFVVDPRANIVSHRGWDKRLEPKVIDLLCFLAAHRNEVLSRAEISEAVWPRVVVGEDAITRTIFALRNALGDDAKNPKFIETIPKKGYRFLGEVSVVESPTFSLSRWRMILAVSVVMLVCISGGYRLLSLGQSVRLELGEIEPLTSDLGTELDMALSVKAQKIAYVQNDPESRHIYVHDLITGSRELLDQGSDWSKARLTWIDEDILAYVRKREGIRQIVQQGIGEEIKVLYETSMGLRHLAYSPKSNVDLFFVEEVTPVKTALKSINLVSGKVEDLRDAFPNIPEKVLYPLFSADGTKLYLTGFDEQTPHLISLDLQTSEINLISTEFEKIRSVNLGPRGTLLAAAIKDNKQGIWSIGLGTNSDSELILQPSGADRINQVLWNSLTNELYYSNYKGDSDLQLFSIADGSVDPLRELNSDGKEFRGSFSSDRGYIYFCSDRTGFPEVWRYHVAEERLEKLTDNKSVVCRRPIASNSGDKFAVIFDDEAITLGVFSVDSGEILVKKALSNGARLLSWSMDDKYLYVEEKLNASTLYRFDSHTMSSEVVRGNAGTFVKEYEGGMVFVDKLSNTIVKFDLERDVSITLSEPINGLSMLWPGQLDISGNTLAFMGRVDGLHTIQHYSFIGDQRITSKETILPLNSRVSDMNVVDSKLLVRYDKVPSGDIMRINLK